MYGFEIERKALPYWPIGEKRHRNFNVSLYKKRVSQMLRPAVQYSHATMGLY